MKNDIYLDAEIRISKAEILTIDQAWETVAINWWFWRLLWFESPAVLAATDKNNLLKIKAKRVYLLAPGQSLYRKVLHSTDHLFIHFHTLSIPESISKQIFSGLVLLDADPILFKLIGELVKALRTNSSVAHLSALSIVAHSLSQGIQHSTKAKQTIWKNAISIPNVIQKAQRLAVEKKGLITVSNLAERSGYSNDHFTRLFSKTLACTPATYLKELRMNEAARRLIHSDESIESIAENLAFSDRFHFSKVFAKQCGVSPAKYRKMHRV